MNKTLFGVLVMLFGVFISAISQVLLKKSALQKHESRIKEYLNPYVIGAYSLFVIATICTMLAYRGISIAWASVLECTSYFYITYFGITIFHEKMNTKKYIALGCILCGILVFSLFR